MWRWTWAALSAGPKATSCLVVSPVRTTSRRFGRPRPPPNWPFGGSAGRTAAEPTAGEVLPAQLEYIPMRMAKPDTIRSDSAGCEERMCGTSHRLQQAGTNPTEAGQQHVAPIPQLHKRGNVRSTMRSQSLASLRDRGCSMWYG